MGGKPAKSPRRDYYAGWYQENRDRISRKRKDLYHGDDGYKEKVLSQSAAYRKDQRAVPRVRVPRHQVPRSYKTGDGGTIVLYSIGFFALFLSRSVQSINQWEKDGIMPRTPYRSGLRGFRFYTRAMMEVVKSHVGDKRRLYPVDPGMHETIKGAWERSGVPLECEDGIDDAVRLTKTGGKAEEASAS